MIYQDVEYIAVQGERCGDCALVLECDYEIQCPIDEDTVWHKGHEAPTKPPFDTEAQVKEYLLNPENYDKVYNHNHIFCPISGIACSINCPGYKQPSYRQNFDKWVVIIGRCDSPMLVRRWND